MKALFTFKTNPKVDHHIAQEMCGLLPRWVRDYTLFSMIYDGNIVDWMTEAYGFGPLYDMKGAVMNKKYVGLGDDDLDYIALSEIDEGTVFYFPYGIIALPIEGGHFITRMD